MCHKNVLVNATYDLPPARQRGRLADPRCHHLLVEVVLVDVDPARFLRLASGWSGSQRRAFEEGHFDVIRKRMEAEEPALSVDAIERRVPFDGLAHAGNRAHDERVES